MSKSVHPTFYTDTGLWEAEGMAAPSIRELKELLPKGTRIIGFYQKGSPPIPRSAGQPMRPVLPHAKHKKSRNWVQKDFR